MARRAPDLPVRNLRADRNNAPGVSGPQDTRPKETIGGRMVEDVISQLHANPFYNSRESTGNRDNGPGVRGPNGRQDRSGGPGVHANTAGGSTESSDEPEERNGWRGRVRHFLSFSRLVSVVKTTVDIVTLMTSLALILVQITTPQPDFDALVSRSATVGRLQNQVLLLEKQLQDRKAIFSCLTDVVTSLNEQAENRSAFIDHQGIKVSTLEKRLDNCSALDNHHVDQYNLTENSSALVGHFKNDASTGEGCFFYRSELGRLLEDRVSTLEERLENRSAIASSLDNRVSTLEERLEKQSALAIVNPLENRVSTLEEGLENSAALGSHLKNELSTLEERLDNREALVTRLEDQISTLEDHSKTCSAQVGRLENQLSSHNQEQGKVLFSRRQHEVSASEKNLKTRLDLVDRLAVRVSVLEERLKNQLALEDQVSTLEEQSKTCSVGVRNLEGQLSSQKKRLKCLATTVKKRLKTRSADVSRLEGQVSALEERLENREELSDRPALETRQDKKQPAHVQPAIPPQTDPKTDQCIIPGHVFNIKSPDGDFKYTFDEGRQACAERGAVLASRVQMLLDPPTTNWAGRCGWMSDKRAGSVKHTVTSDCLNRKAFYQCTTHLLWNAWCFCPAGTRHD